MVANSSHNLDLLAFASNLASNNLDLEPESSSQTQCLEGLNVPEKIYLIREVIATGTPQRQLIHTPLECRTLLQRSDSNLKLWVQEVRILTSKQVDLLSALLKCYQQQLMSFVLTPSQSERTQRPNQPRLLGHGSMSGTKQVETTHALNHRLARLRAAGVPSDRILYNNELDAKAEQTQFNQLMSLVHIVMQVIAAICWFWLVLNNEFYRQFQDQIQLHKVELRLLEDIVECSKGFMNPVLIRHRRSKDGKL